MKYHPYVHVYRPGLPDNSSAGGGSACGWAPLPARQAAVLTTDHTRPPFPKNTMQSTFSLQMLKKKRGRCLCPQGKHLSIHLCLLPSPSTFSYMKKSKRKGQMIKKLRASWKTLFHMHLHKALHN